MEERKDIISRQAAIDALKEQADAMSTWTAERYKQQSRGIRTAINILEDLPTVEPKPEWIPISLDGKLPEEEQICLVCGKNGGMCVARFCGRGNILLWTKTGTGKFVYPVAWMPLPEPWRKE